MNPTQSRSPSSSWEADCYSHIMSVLANKMSPNPHFVNTDASVRLSVRLFVRNSVPCTNKVKYLKFGWWFSDQTGTVGLSMGSSHFTDIPHPYPTSLGVGRGQNVGLRELCHIVTLLSPGASVFPKHMSSLILHLYIYPYAPTKYYPFWDKYHASFHMYGLHQAAFIGRESNPRSLALQAED